MDEADRYLPEFTEDYNRRFGRAARNDHDAHRPLLDHDHHDDIFSVFCWAGYEPLESTSGSELIGSCKYERGISTPGIAGYVAG